MKCPDCEGKLVETGYRTEWDGKKDAIIHNVMCLDCKAKFVEKLKNLKRR